MMDRDENPDAPPTAEEIADAEALREALADPSRASAPADFLRSVALAHQPRELSRQAHAAILSRSIVRGEVRRADARARRTRVIFAVTGGLAMAAAIALLVGREAFAPEATREPLLPGRSTQALFHEPFARVGGESARIDRIASARAVDLRENRFAAWGVR
jgi:hypothetical protein